MSNSNVIVIRPGLALPKAELESLCTRFEVAELSLFGSSAKLSYRDDSDVDILVQFKDGARIGLIRFITLMDELSDRLGCKVDLVSKPGLNSEIRAEVLASSRVLYAA